MRALLRLVIAFLIALVGLGTASGPTHALGSPESIGAYDSVDASTVVGDVAHERGPPWAYDYVTTYGTTRRSSVGPLARFDESAPHVGTTYDASGKPVHDARADMTREQFQGDGGDLSSFEPTGVAAKGGSRIAANQAAGNAARDALAAAHPGSLIEQSFSTTAGVRRLDVLTQGGLGIESKVGRTSLTAATRSQIAKDSLLLGNGDVTGMEWVFSRSGVTGKIGPTGPMAEALGKAGIPWSLAP